MILERPHLFKVIEGTLTDALVEFTRTSSHGTSFKKYLARLEENGIHIPERVIQKIMDYLSSSQNE